ncbi:MAG: 1,4-alpha-glucan branching enzyme, partial [Cyclobacteriaceae bacterium]
MATPQKAEKDTQYSRFTDFDIHLFRSGRHFELHHKMGSHPVEHNGTTGCYFAVWAPSARSVSVIGNFNHWDNSRHQLNARWDSSGIWEGFFPGVSHGEAYKYSIETQEGYRLEKG